MLRVKTKYRNITPLVKRDSILTLHKTNVSFLFKIILTLIMRVCQTKINDGINLVNFRNEYVSIVSVLIW